MHTNLISRTNTCTVPVPVGGGGGGIGWREEKNLTKNVHSMILGWFRHQQILLLAIPK